jgi:hypothetical protein
MVAILAKCLYTVIPAHIQRSVVVNAGIDNGFHPLAYQMMTATNAICRLDYGTDDRPGPRRWARGAVIEKIGGALLRVRRPDLLTEQYVGPLDPKDWKDGVSDSIDFVAPDAPAEFWDAKSVVGRIKSHHIHQFEVLLDLAGAGSMAGFITLEGVADLADRLDGWLGFTKPIHAYTYENFETMVRDRPVTRVDSWA